MPELPEVESTVLYLRSRLPGRTITDVTVRWPRSIATPPAAQFRQLLLGRQFGRIERRGKFIVMHMHHTARKPAATYLLIHLRMSGYLEFHSVSDTPGKHDQVIVSLDDQSTLNFHDTRKFGRMWLVTDPAEVTAGLGAEPLEPDFSWEALRKILGAHRGRIKSLLLNQRLLAGVGNIYADEALWSAGIHPLTPGHRVSAQKVRLLHAALRKILRRAIARHGTDAGDRVVKGGRYRPKVYQRQGKRCLRCGTYIRKITVAQRGTHICLKCQRRVTAL